MSEKKKGSKTTVKYFDYSLLVVLIFLLCFGLVMLYSTTYYKHGTELLSSQVKAILFSFFIMRFVAGINYHRYVKLAKYMYWFSIFLMALVKVPGIGIERYGARRWIKIPVFGQMQPSEVTKIAVILFIPVLLCSIGKRIGRKEGLIKVLVWGGIAAAGVLILTENLSTAVIVMGMVCIMIFVAHPKTAPFLILLGIGIFGLWAAAQVLGNMMDTSQFFRLRRILVWLKPEEYEAEGGYQIMQALYAIGSGGFWGKGLGNSSQKMIMPEAQNDMILAVICEELGVFGVIILLLLFGMLLYRLMFIAQNAPDMYGSLIVSGIFAHIALQVILNVCVVSKVLPPTGITLPFISYGGTSILFLMIEMGIAFNVSMMIKFER